MMRFKRNQLAGAVMAFTASIATGSLSAQSGEQAEHSALEEVVVTVERREQSLQSVAGVAQAFDQDSLNRLGVGTSFQNLQNIVPGMNIADQEGNMEIYIRGVGSSNNTELGDPAAATHLNGVYIPRPRGVGAMFYDIERVEVKKGPQGTLRGRNATAGTLNIVTKRPDFDNFGGDFEVTTGNYSTFGVRGAVNLPVTDNFAVRFAAYTEEHDPYFSNASADSSLDAAGSEDVQSFRLSALWEISEATSLYVVADSTDEGGTGYPGAQIKQALQNGYDFDDLDDPREVLYRGTEGDLDSSHTGVMAVLTHEFDGFSVELSSSYRDLDFEQVNAANDGVYFPGHDEVNQQNYSSQYWITLSESTVHELRLFSNGDGPLTWSTGIFHFQEDQQAALFSLTDGGTWYTGTEWVMPDVDSSSTAVYADLSYDFTDELTAFAGIRHTTEEKSRFGTGGNWAFAFFEAGDEWGTALPSRIGTPGFEYDGLGRSNYDILGASDAELYAYLLDGIGSWGVDDNLDDQIACVTDPSCTDITMPWTVGAPVQQKGSYEDDYIDFRTGLTYQLTDSSMLFASIASGHKSGGFNDTLVMPDGELVAEPYAPEKLVMYEVGTKNEFDLGPVPTRLNASFFYYDYTDQVFQMIVATGDDESASSLQNRNIADSEITGLEIESKFLLPANLTLDMTALWLNAEIKEGVMADTRQGWGTDLPIVDLSGNTLPLAPDFTFNLALSQQIESDLGTFDWTLSAQYRSDYYLTIWNNTDYDLVDGETVVGSDPDYADAVDGYLNLDAGLGFTDNSGRFRIEAYGANLTDEVVSQKGIIDHGNNLRFTNLPRTYGMRFKVNF
ncbi:iron complex outermembrane recepter protein [Microbulbifer thermotolerans]|uniref:TonB-dependent receptor n=2 Tax=Microbulbifer thermotolerans TaxID=252514 RepID=UPI0008E2E6E9|nr:TonB-dependent receptor [Microbulbifer thermotolerans]SFC72997.1 iron complex outermembrane recepter protein [Microbulbifer thermotolerans]